MRNLWKIIMKPREISENGTKAFNIRCSYLFPKKNYKYRFKKQLKKFVTRVSYFSLRLFL